MIVGLIHGVRAHSLTRCESLQCRIISLIQARAVMLDRARTANRMECGCRCR
jgi:hypothetical protein